MKENDDEENKNVEIEPDVKFLLAQIDCRIKLLMLLNLPMAEKKLRLDFWRRRKIWLSGGDEKNVFGIK